MLHISTSILTNFVGIKTKQKDQKKKKKPNNKCNKKKQLNTVVQCQVIIAYNNLYVSSFKKKIYIYIPVVSLCNNLNTTIKSLLEWSNEETVWRPSNKI